MKRYPAYKDSGFDWLKEVPEHWEQKSVRALTKVKTERNKPDLPLLSVYRDYGVIYKDSRDDNHNRAGMNLSSYKVVAPNNLVLNKMKTWQGSLGVSQLEGIVSPAYIVCDLDEGINGRYLNYLLRCRSYVHAYNRISYGVRVDQWDMRYEDFKQLPVFLPSSDEQAAIVAFLEEQTAVINQFLTNKRRLIALLEEQKQVVINTAVTQGLDTAVARKPSGIDWLGDIPSHWSLKRLKRISPELSVGVVVTPSEYYDESGSVPFLLGSNISEGKISLKDVRKISEDSNELLAKSKLKAGDLVTVRVGYPGVTAVIPPSLDGCNCASMMIIRQSSKFNSDWLCHVMNSSIIKEQIEVVKYGAAQKQFNISHAVNFIVPFPPKDEQQQILDFIRLKTAEINAVIERTQREIELIEEYRTTLIATAVTGKINVSV